MGDRVGEGDTMTELTNCLFCSGDGCAFCHPPTPPFNELTKELIKVAMNEAYWSAAWAMCRRCAEGASVAKLPYLDGTVELIHEIPHKQLGKVEENCQAAPIHALIEKLNEVTQ